MFCTNNSDQRAIKAISKQIDKDLKLARRKLRTEKKLLLLGKRIYMICIVYLIYYFHFGSKIQEWILKEKILQFVLLLIELNYHLTKKYQI